MAEIFKQNFMTFGHMSKKIVAKKNSNLEAALNSKYILSHEC